MENLNDSDFDRLFCSMLPRLYRRAAQVVGEQSAGDAVHDAYLRVRRQRRRFLTHPEPFAYTFAAVTSAARDNWRRMRRQQPMPWPAEHLVVHHGGIEEWEAEAETTRLLAGLTARQAAAVRLVDLEGYTIDEAAGILRVHRGTVSRTRKRALDSLRISALEI